MRLISFQPVVNRVWVLNRKILQREKARRPGYDRTETGSIGISTVIQVDIKALQIVLLVGRRHVSKQRFGEDIVL